VGPGGQGSWSAGRVAFGHRRLSVIDLSTCGSQPMVDNELGLTAVFNGCIYDYRELPAAAALDVSVTGLDFLVPDASGPEYVFIEANERPGLANHEPQPVVERFVDLIFPETRRR
jgi:hypothetical protein